MFKRLKSKTYWLAIITAVTANLPALSDSVSASTMGYLMFGFAIAGAIIRELTTGPVGDK